MCLEELELLLACGSSCDNLHDSLQLGIRACSSGKHVYNGIGRGGGGCLRRRGCLHGFGRLWRAWLGLLLYWLASLVFGVLIGLVVVVIWPWSIWRCCRSLLLHWLAHLTRAIESDGQRMRLDDKLHAHSVSTDLGEILKQLLLSRRLRLVFIGAVGQLLGLIEVGVEGAEVCAGQPYCLGPLEGCL